MRSRDGSEASCECLESCPSLGDHEGSSPVCGTDGADYPSLCEMNRAACAKGANITMAFQGKCGEYWKNSEKNISSTLDYAFSSLWNPLSKIILVILLLLKYVTTIIVCWGRMRNERLRDLRNGFFFKKLAFPRDRIYREGERGRIIRRSSTWKQIFVESKRRGEEGA